MSYSVVLSSQSVHPSTKIHFIAGDCACWKGKRGFHRSKYPSVGGVRERLWRRTFGRPRGNSGKLGDNERMQGLAQAEFGRAEEPLSPNLQTPSTHSLRKRRGEASPYS